MLISADTASGNILENENLQLLDGTGGYARLELSGPQWIYNCRLIPGDTGFTGIRLNKKMEISKADRIVFDFGKERPNFTFVLRFMSSDLQIAGVFEPDSDNWNGNSLTVSLKDFRGERMIKGINPLMDNHAFHKFKTMELSIQARYPVEFKIRTAYIVKENLPLYGEMALALMTVLNILFLARSPRLLNPSGNDTSFLIPRIIFLLSSVFVAYYAISGKGDLGIFEFILFLVFLILFLVDEYVPESKKTHMLYPLRYVISISLYFCSIPVFHGMAISWMIFTTLIPIMFQDKKRLFLPASAMLIPGLLLQLFFYESPFSWLNGLVMGITVIGAITLQELGVLSKQQDKLRGSTLFYQGVLRAVQEAVLVIDSDCLVRQCNDSFKIALNLQDKDIIGKDIRKMFEFREEFKAELRTLFSCSRRIEGEVDYRNYNNKPRTALVQISPLWERYQLLGYIVTATDISLRQKLQARLESQNRQLAYQAETDRLTGLANRRKLDKFLDQEWRRAMREGAPLSLLMIDVDYFKRYNDAYGHLAGDECLRAVSRRIQHHIQRAGDLAARFGGEEMCVLLPGVDERQGYLYGEKLRQDIEALQIPHEGSSVSSVVTISVGCCSLVPQPEISSRLLIERADQALYLAKNKGRNRCRSFSGMRDSQRSLTIR